MKREVTIQEAITELAGLIQTGQNFFLGISN
jgi:hypothetical protein